MDRILDDLDPRPAFPRPLDVHGAFAELGRVSSADTSMDVMLLRTAELAEQVTPGVIGMPAGRHQD